MGCLWVYREQLLGKEELVGCDTFYHESKMRMYAQALSDMYGGSSYGRINRHELIHDANWMKQLQLWVSVGS